MINKLADRDNDKSKRKDTIENKSSTNLDMIIIIKHPRLNYTSSVGQWTME